MTVPTRNILQNGYVFENVFRDGYNHYTIQQNDDTLMVEAVGLRGVMRYTVDAKSTNYDGFTLYPYCTFDKKEEKIMTLGFWESFKLVNPHVGELYETEQEFREAVIAAGNMVYAETALADLEHVFHPANAKAETHPVFNSEAKEAARGDN